MVHQWFLHFGEPALVLGLLAYVALALVVISFGLLCLGIPAAIPGWIGAAFAGITFAFLTAKPV